MNAVVFLVLLCLGATSAQWTHPETGGFHPAAPKRRFIAYETPQEGDGLLRDDEEEEDFEGDEDDEDSFVPFYTELLPKQEDVDAASFHLGYR